MPRVPIAGKEDLDKVQDSVSHVDEASLSVDDNVLTLNIKNSGDYPVVQAHTTLPTLTGGGSGNKLSVVYVPVEGVTLYPFNTGSTVIISQDSATVIDLAPHPTSGKYWGRGDYIDVIQPSSYYDVDDRTITLTTQDNKVVMHCSHPARFIVVDEISERNSGIISPSIQEQIHTEPIKDFSSQMKATYKTVSDLDLTVAQDPRTICAVFKPTGEEGCFWTEDNPLRLVYASLLNMDSIDLSRYKVTYVFYGCTARGTEELILGDVTLDYEEIMSKISTNIPKPLVYVAEKQIYIDSYFPCRLPNASNDQKIGITKIVAFIDGNRSAFLLKNLWLSPVNCYPNGSLPYTCWKHSGSWLHWLPDWTRCYPDRVNIKPDFVYEKFDPTTLRYEVGHGVTSPRATFFSAAIDFPYVHGIFITLSWNGGAYDDESTPTKYTTKLILGDEIKTSLYLIACDAEGVFKSAIRAQYVERLQGWWIPLSTLANNVVIKTFRLAFVDVDGSNVGNDNFKDGGQMRAAIKLMQTLLLGSDPCLAFRTQQAPLQVVPIAESAEWYYDLPREFEYPDEY